MLGLSRRTSATTAAPPTWQPHHLATSPTTTHHPPRPTAKGAPAMANSLRGYNKLDANFAVADTAIAAAIEQRPSTSTRRTIKWGFLWPR